VSSSLVADETVCAGASFTNFKSLSQDEVRDLIGKATSKSCPLYPMPTFVVLQVLDVLLPVITAMINMSFETCHFAEAWKEALSPLLKKCGLKVAFKNFRPVSNLPYFSKLSERVVANQLKDYRPPTTYIPHTSRRTRQIIALKQHCSESKTIS